MQPGGIVDDLRLKWLKREDQFQHFPGFNRLASFSLIRTARNFCGSFFELLFAGPFYRNIWILQRKTSCVNEDMAESKLL